MSPTPDCSITSAPILTAQPAAISYKWLCYVMTLVDRARENRGYRADRDALLALLKLDHMPSPRDWLDGNRSTFPIWIELMRAVAAPSTRDRVMAAAPKPTCARARTPAKLRAFAIERADGSPTIAIVHSCCEYEARCRAVWFFAGHRDYPRRPEETIAFPVDLTTVPAKQLERVIPDGALVGHARRCGCGEVKK
jgi:hypothetical protein